MIVRKNQSQSLKLKLLLVTLVTLLISNIFAGVLVPSSSADSAPSGVILYTPTNNAYLNTSTPILMWYPSFDAEGSPLRYVVEVDESGGDWLSLVAYNLTAYNITSWQITSPLLDGQTYQWRVRADDGLNQTNSTGPWSPVWYFTVDLSVPSILNGSADFTTYTGNSFTIYANFTDNIDVSSATIYYKKIPETTYRSQLMIEPQNLDQYYITNQMLGINTTFDDEDYLYYIIAEDPASNVITYANPGGMSFVITVIDNIPPEHLYGSANFTTTTDDEFTIFINCWDNIGLGNAWLNIHKLGRQWQSIKLNNYYTAGFIINYTDLKPGIGLDTSDGIDCEYFILVYDQSNNVHNYSGSWGAPWLIEVIDNDNPVAIGGSGNLLITTGDDFEIFTNFTDNVGVTSSILYIEEHFDTISYLYNLSMTEVSINNFTIRYADLLNHPELQMNTTNSGNYEYYVNGYDNANNKCNYSQAQNKSWAIIIIDNDAPTLLSCSGDFEVKTDDHFTIYANFSDNINVANAKIYLFHTEIGSEGETNKTTGEDWSNTWMMKEFDGNIARFSISYGVLKSELGLDTTYGGKIEYYILVSDAVGNKVELPKGTAVFWEITIVDNDPPFVLGGSGDFTVSTGEDIDVYADFNDNLEVVTATLFYQPIITGTTQQNIGWLESEMTVSFNSTGYFTATATALDIDTVTKDMDYYYYVVAYDGEDNSISYGSRSDPFKISVVDTASPVIESWDLDPSDLNAGHSEDLIVKVTISDTGGSGFDAHSSVELRYKRGSFDSAYCGYYNMELITKESATVSNPKLVTEWQYMIPSPEAVTENHDHLDSWALISEEYIFYELWCSDLEGNIIESGVSSEYIDPVAFNHAPVVNLITPNGNENFTRLQYIFWQATDPDNDEIYITLELSEDNGLSWQILAVNLNNNGTYRWDTTNLSNNNKYIIKITASDGESSSSDRSESTFTIYNLDASQVPGEEFDEGLEPASNNITDILPLIIASIIIAIIVASGAFIGGTEIGKYKFLSLVLVPLYSKLHHDEVLDHFVRGQIFGYIQANPGEHYNAIKESLELNNGTLSHHLKILEKEDYIYSKRDGFYSRFYPKGMKITPTDAAQLNKIQKIIVNKIRERPGLTQHEIVTLIGTSQQVVSYNLTKLARDNILKIDKQGREKRYVINDEVVLKPELQVVQSPQLAQPVESQKVNVTTPPTPAIATPAPTTSQTANPPTNTINTGKNQE